LLDVPVEMIASVPVPIPRTEGLAGEVTLAYAPVEKASALVALENAFAVRGDHSPARAAYAAATDRGAEFFSRIASYLVGLKQTLVAWPFGQQDIAAELDPITTATIPGRTELP
jgi:hypothetical protein